jgi:uncharacterized protein
MDPATPFVPADRLTGAPSRLCAGYTSLLEHIDEPMKLMAGLLRSGRYADEAMALLTASG